MVNHKEILRLKHLEHTNVQIAKICDCGRNTVTRTLQQAQKRGIAWTDVQELSEESVSAALFSRSSTRPNILVPDYPCILQDVHYNDTSLMQAWRNYYDRCIEAGNIPYKRSQFYKHFSTFQKAVCENNLNDFPGEVMKSGWYPLKKVFIDPSTGEVKKVWLFIAVLLYSGYAYGEIFQDKSTNTWLRAHINAYNRFSGVTKYLELNDKKSCENRIKQDLAHHYGTIIRHAESDSDESSEIMDSLRKKLIHLLQEEQFYSIDDMNHCLTNALGAYHNEIADEMKKAPVSRFDIERDFLLHIPFAPFEAAQWKEAVVQFNCHINVENQNYSVPYQYLHKKVDVKLTSREVDIYFSGERVTTHMRLLGRLNQYSTDAEHMPPKEVAECLRWNRKRFVQWAEEIGPGTAEVIRNYLAMYIIEQQGYKSCMTLLSLANNHPRETVEAACTQALCHTSRPPLKLVRSFL